MSSTARPSPLRAIVNRAVSATKNEEIDESLLRASLPSVRIGVLTDRSLSIGIGVPPDAAYLDRARDLGLPIVRRASGGSAVLHAPGDLTWSIVLPRTDPRVGRTFVHAYGRFGAGIVHALAGLGVEAAWTSPLALAEQYCLLSGRGSVLTVGRRVLGGAAQHATRSALLHHGVVPWTVDRRLVRDLFGLPAAPVDRLVGLAELTVGDRSDELATRLAASLIDSLRSSPADRDH